VTADLVYIWDSKDPLPSEDNLIITTDFSEESGKLISIPVYIEQNDKHIRDLFLKWTFDLGERKIGSKRLIDLLSIDKDFSYWWMSPFIETHPYNFPVKNAIFLFALDEIIKNIEPKSIILKTNQNWLMQTVMDFCKRKGIKFENQKSISFDESIKESASVSSSRIMLNALRSIARHIIRIRKYKESPNLGWISDSKSILLSGYFVNFNKTEAEKGIFKSAYWGDLPEILTQTGYSINWLHHNSYSSPLDSLKLVNNFNEVSGGKAFHTFAEGNFSFLVVLHVLIKWIRLNFLSLRTRNMEENFQISPSGLSAWPLFKDLWEDWIRGPQSIANLFVLETFINSLKAAPKQKIGLFILENNAFERAFAYAWKRNGHGLLVGVQHSTIRFWDLRYFNNQHILVDKGPDSLPQADLMAVNGPVAEGLLLDSNYPHERIVQVEALRYLNSESPEILKSKAIGDKKTLLVLGDISYESTSATMNLLSHLPHKTKELLNILVKPHPICPIKRSDFPLINFELYHGSFNEIFRKECIIYGANSTSSCVDAYMTGQPVIIHHEQSSLNLSPLKGVNSVTFVSCSNELNKAITEILENGFKQVRPKDFFWLDKELPRWRAFFDKAASKLFN
jgi:surface carbohydrate biosynthesis protein (TIGR04326 family)